ncbi:MAG TPA: DUF5916 domain-containing protein [Thermoanaerobaculia bacterium]|jgi:hypothetical protein|nr:DUF5916 domain-containing protein [Thermoanaerobaculia bacterium]
MRLRLAVLLTGLMSAAALSAEDVPAPLTVKHATASITIDGDLSDPGWRDAATIDRFYETSPGNNTPPKVKTIVFLTYDDRYFYIGVRADDPEPRTIRAPYVERDNVIGTDDNIAVFLDTRNDKRSALELRVNPRGIQGDAIFNDANQNEDFSPDFFYDTAAKIDSTGWSAEYRIPFSSLRYAHADPQSWNILVWRNYPRDFRYGIHSAPLPRGSNCLICHAHPITGLTNLPEAGHFVAAPYATAQRLDKPRFELGSGLERGNTTSDTGLDVKWNPSATHAVDLTLNPDFSQVESDIAQITVNQRFAVFFPEKRPFFLEGVDLFDTPLQIVYTRTITAPRWGARATGKIGGSAYTLLITEDRGGGLTIVPGTLGSLFAPQDFRSTNAIGRIRHDLGSSFIGAVFTDREVRGGGHNRVIGPDFQWRPSDSDAVTGELLYNQNENPNRPDLLSLWTGQRSSSHALYAGWTRQKQRYDWWVEGRDIGNEFRADLGFVPQVGYRDIEGAIALRSYPENRLLSFVRTSFFVDRTTDTDGNLIFRRIAPGVTTFGAKNLQAQLVLRIRDRSRVGSQLLDETYLTGFVQFDPSRRFPRISVTGRAGEMIDFANARRGRGHSVNFGATIRPHDKVTFDANLNHETLRAADSRVYTAIVERLKTTYSFSASSLIRVIGQYVKNDSASAGRSGDFSGSVLYSYRLNWQTVFFVGYGDDRVLMPDNSLARLQRSFFTKVSYAIQR